MRKPPTINDTVLSNWLSQKLLHSDTDMNIVYGVQTVAAKNTKKLTSQDLDMLSTCFVTSDQIR